MAAQSVIRMTVSLWTLISLFIPSNPSIPRALSVFIFSLYLSLNGNLLIFFAPDTISSTVLSIDYLAPLGNAVGKCTNLGNGHSECIWVVDFPDASNQIALQGSVSTGSNLSNGEVFFFQFLFLSLISFSK